MQGRRPPATPGRHLAADAAITSRPGRSSKRHLASVPRTVLDAVPRSCGSRAGKEGGATFSPQRSQRLHCGPRFFLRQNPEWPGRPPDPSLLLAHLETGLRTVTELCGPQAGEQHGLPGDIAEGCSEAAEVGVGRTGCLQVPPSCPAAWPPQPAGHGGRALGEGERPAMTPSLSFHKRETEAGRTELI